MYVYLQDLLSNENIKLDWTFRLSLLKDIAKVKKYYICTLDILQVIPLTLMRHNDIVVWSHLLILINLQRHVCMAGLKPFLP